MSINNCYVMLTSSLAAFDSTYRPPVLIVFLTRLTLAAHVSQGPVLLSCVQENSYSSRFSLMKMQIHVAVCTYMTLIILPTTRSTSLRIAAARVSWSRMKLESDWWRLIVLLPILTTPTCTTQAVWHPTEALTRQPSAFHFRVPHEPRSSSRALKQDHSVARNSECGLGMMGCQG